MGGGRLAAYGLALAALVATAWVILLSSHAASRDASTVYCLLPEHRGDLVRAAVSLSVAAPGSTTGDVRTGGRHLTLDRWRAADGADFQRACGALASAQSAGTGSSGGTSEASAILGVLLPVIAGALLTMLAGDFRQASDRRWSQADELRTSWQALAAVITAYAEERRTAHAGGVQPPTEVNDRRREFLANLRKVNARHRGSPTINDLRTELTSGSLGPGFADSWGGSTPEERSSYAEKVKRDVAAAGESAEAVAQALGRQVWLSSRL
jgi:hypothetical protein